MRILLCMLATFCFLPKQVKAEDEKGSVEVVVQKAPAFSNYSDAKKSAKENGKNLILVFFSDIDEPRFANFSEGEFAKEICCMAGSAEYVLFDKGLSDPNVVEFLGRFLGFEFPVGGTSMTTILIDCEGEDDFILEFGLLKDLKHH